MLSNKTLPTINWEQWWPTKQHVNSIQSRRGSKVTLQLLLERQFSWYGTCWFKTWLLFLIVHMIHSADIMGLVKAHADGQALIPLEWEHFELYLKRVLWNVVLHLFFTGFCSSINRREHVFELPGLLLYVLFSTRSMDLRAMHWRDFCRCKNTIQQTLFSLRGNYPGSHWRHQRDVPWELASITQSWNLVSQSQHHERVSHCEDKDITDKARRRY